MATNAKAVVTVNFLNGDTRDYLITATKGISARLAATLGETDVMALWNDDEAFGIPLAHVRDYSIRDLTREEQDAESGPKPRYADSRDRDEPDALPDFITGSGDDLIEEVA